MRFTLNGRKVTIAAHPMSRLLDVLREDLKLPGTKEGCGEGECGACTVLVDGEPVCACLVPVAQVQGAKVSTIEGLGGHHALQKCFLSEGGAQCGICTPGMIMAACALPKKPSLDAIRTGLAGNLCRCTGYEAIYRSILKSHESPVLPFAHEAEPKVMKRLCATLKSNIHEVAGQDDVTCEQFQERDAPARGVTCRDDGLVKHRDVPRLRTGDRRLGTSP